MRPVIRYELKMSKYVLNHPLLGQVQGVEEEGAILRYLGLQHATLKDRFSRGLLVDRRARTE